MKWVARYIISLLPVGLIGEGVLLAKWADKTLDCVWHGKEITPCFALSIDVSPFLGFGLFWLRLLLPFVGLVSLAGFLYVAISNIEYLYKRTK